MMCIILMICDTYLDTYHGFLNTEDSLNIMKIQHNIWHNVSLHIFCSAIKHDTVSIYCRMKVYHGTRKRIQCRG